MKEDNKAKGDTTKQYRAQLEAAYELLSEESTTGEKIEKLKTLVSGINPKVDKELTKLTTVFNHLKAALDTNIVHLTTHTLPENTEQQKKHKKLFLLFLSSWKSLKSEVKRVQGYYEQQTLDPSSTHLAGSTAKTVLFAKGPFGVITGIAIIAVGIIAITQKAFTEITIENKGCPPIAVPTKLPINIPGIKLPQESISNESVGVATIPALSVSVHASSSVVTATALGQTGKYTLPARTADILYDGVSLVNKTTTLKLASSRSHVLTIICR